ncbi:hypothetical protein L195_g050975 [Trifolium pratense]|uniref:Uncharacterized protein n=1 Tax=Trifolium pratense TaxID=57577 RepID=A0A2K3JWZ8_TRIPR|nr:hypothetical protein L195_g050975 [Trifolium pratense]
MRRVGCCAANLYIKDEACTPNPHTISSPYFSIAAGKKCLIGNSSTLDTVLSAFSQGNELHVIVEKWIIMLLPFSYLMIEIASIDN